MSVRPRALAAAGEAFLAVLRARRPDLYWSLVGEDEAGEVAAADDVALLVPPDDSPDGA